MPRFKDQAICIRHIDWSETSQIVALFTREHGKIRGLAKGSKRTSPGAVARFCGGIELLTRGEVVATLKPTTELAAITEWDLQDPYFHLHTDLPAQHLAMYAADLIGAMTADRDPHPGAFEALVRLLEELGQGRSAATPQAAGKNAAWRAAGLLRFQWELLADCGFRPQLERDVVTDEPLDGAGSALWFDAHAGGLTAAPDPAAAYPGAARPQQAGPWRVRGETVALLRRLAANPQAGDDAEHGSVDRANKLLCVYARAILDRELPTMGMVLGNRKE